MEQSFTLDTGIYSTEDIHTAIEDFSDVAAISYKKGVLVISAESQEDSEEIFNEFMNYVLSV